MSSDEEQRTQNEGCFGEEVGAYISAPLMAQMYILGHLDEDSVKDLIASAVTTLVKNVNRGIDDREALTEVTQMLDVIAVSMVTLWYGTDIHICDQIGLAAEKATELIEVTADDVMKVKK